MEKVKVGDRVRISTPIFEEFDGFVVGVEQDGNYILVADEPDGVPTGINIDNPSCKYTIL